MLTDEQKRFEKTHCGGNLHATRKNTTTGDYVLPSVQDAWSGWRSAIEAEVRAEARPVCKCSMRIKLVGDGCEVCNPDLAAEIRADNERDEKEAQEPVTSELISSALAAITFYGSQKWSEGKGLISDTALLDVRQAWDAVYNAIQKLAAPQPPAPCHLPLEKSRYCPDCEALQDKIAELKEKMFSESAEFVHFMQIDHPKALGERDSTIAQQAERIAELETRLEENAMPDDYILMADKLSAQAALIEQCERCLKDLSGMGWADEALAAIAAHQSQP